MYSLYGLNGLLRNLYCIGAARGGWKAEPDLTDLHSAYLDLLADYLPNMPVDRGAGIFVTDPATEDALAVAYSGRGANGLDDMRQNELISREALPPDLKQDYAERIRDAITDLTNHDEMLGVAFELVIHSIFLRASNPLPNVRRSYGGSSGGAVGAIWFVPNDSVTHADRMELLVHELTHHLLFVDELVHPQFDYSKITLKQYYAPSAILKQERPLDKVVHSIVVGTELLLWRARTTEWQNLPRTVHPNSGELLKSVRRSLAGLYEVPGLNDCIKPRIVGDLGPV